MHCARTVPKNRPRIRHRRHMLTGKTYRSVMFDGASVPARISCILNLLFAVVASSLPHGLAFPQPISSEEHAFRIVTLVTGLEHPWGLAFLPDGRMLVTERPGRLRIIDKGGKLEPRPVARAADSSPPGPGRAARCRPPSRASRKTTSSISRSRRAARAGIGTEVARGRLAGDRLENVQVIFRMQPKSGGGRHFGSRLVFDREGYLFITLGDRGDQERAQRPGRSRRVGDPTARRRPRAREQSVRRQGRVEAREVHARQPQRAGRGAAPADRRALDARAWAPGRRRGKRDPGGNELRLAGHHLWRGIRHRHEDRRRHPQGRHGAACALLGAFHRPFGNGVLHRRQVPALARRCVHRRVARRDAGETEAGRRESREGGAPAARACWAACATCAAGPTGFFISLPTRRPARLAAARAGRILRRALTDDAARARPRRRCDPRAGKLLPSFQAASRALDTPVRRARRVSGPPLFNSHRSLVADRRVSGRHGRLSRAAFPAARRPSRPGRPDRRAAAALRACAG